MLEVLSKVEFVALNVYTSKFKLMTNPFNVYN